MARNPDQRIARLEKLLGADEAHRRVFAHHQLVALAEHLDKHGSLPENMASVVGPPEVLIGKDEISLAELILAAAARPGGAVEPEGGVA